MSPGHWSVLARICIRVDPLGNCRLGALCGTPLALLYLPRLIFSGAPRKVLSFLPARVGLQKVGVFFFELPVVRRRTTVFACQRRLARIPSSTAAARLCPQAGGWVA